MTDELARQLVPIAALVIFWAVAYVVIQQRTKRESYRTELHAKLLERVGSAREFGEFLGSPAGERFLQAIAPVQPRSRVWASIRTGTFTSVLGVFLLAAAFWRIVGDNSETFTLLGVLVLAFGAASLISVALSQFAARRLGINVPPEDRLSPR